MSKKILISVSATLIVGTSALAQPNTTRIPATLTHRDRTVSVVIPARALEVTPNVFSLGTSVDPKSGRAVEGYAIVRKADGPAKGGNGNAGGGKPDKGGSTATTCYDFLARGAKWRSTENWVVNPLNIYGISDASVLSILEASILQWEDAADGALDTVRGADIFGAGSITADLLEADIDALDNVNEVYFGTLEEGTLAVTIVWGIFGGPPQGRELVGWDQVYNTLYDWSDAGTAGAMDFSNIATHELGHSVGLADLYSSDCSEETMYGYGSEGETKKQTLEAGDIAGVSKLYK